MLAREVGLCASHVALGFAGDAAVVVGTGIIGMQIQHGAEIVDGGRPVFDPQVGASTAKMGAGIVRAFAGRNGATVGIGVRESG